MIIRGTEASSAPSADRFAEESATILNAMQNASLRLYCLVTGFSKPDGTVLTISAFEKLVKAYLQTGLTIFIIRSIIFSTQRS